MQLLTAAERDRLVQLIDVMNTATQVDRDEAMEANKLWFKLTNDGDASPNGPTWIHRRPAGTP